MDTNPLEYEKLIHCYFEKFVCIRGSKNFADVGEVK